jgi:phosphopantetheine--protein transferase-like protein
MSLPHSVWTCYRPLEARLSDDAAALADWLTRAELAELARWRDAARRQQWLQGRRLAKQLIQHATGASSLLAVQVLSRDARGLGIEPRVTVNASDADQQTTDWRLSISHSRRGLLLAVSPATAYRVGVDLVESAPSDEHFERTWFTARERRLLAGDRASRLALLWAIKEAVYKAANRGRSWSPRDVEVLAVDGDLVTCSYRGLALDFLKTDIRQLDGHTAVCACLPADCDHDSFSPATRSMALCS